MFKKILQFSLLIQTFIILSNNSIQTIYSLNGVKEILKNIDQNSLVVFDIDDTLIIPEDHIINDRFAHVELIKNLDEKTLSKIHMHSAQKLIEPCSSEIISDLQKRGIKVIALTARGHGKFHDILKTEKVIFTKLLLLGIDLRNNFSGKIAFDKFNINQFNKFNPDQIKPKFYKGIIFSFGSPKGEVLAHFLDQINLKPTQVIFFDDLMHNLESVQKSMQDRGIKYQGFCYKGSHNHNISLDLDLIQFQLDYLNQTGLWLNDLSAKKLMPLKEAKLVEITKINPRIKIDLVWATENNHLKLNLYPRGAKCYLHDEAAYALDNIQQELEKNGYGLKIFEAFRPLWVQQMVWDKIKFTPTVPNSGRHTLGLAVDLTIIDIKTNNEIIMPPMIYDDMVVDKPIVLTNEQKKNSEFLKNIMMKYGFIPMDEEWFHFDWQDFENYKSLKEFPG